MPSRTLLTSLWRAIRHPAAEPDGRESSSCITATGERERAMDDLRSEWDAATTFAPGAASERWWAVVSRQYTEEGRVYHGRSYLGQLFDLYHRHHDRLANPQAVALAIFFHKLEYNPRSGDSDLKNVEKFDEFVSEAGEEHQDSPLSTSVRSLLEASVSNLTEAHMTEGASGSEDVHYFLDFTTAVLGSTGPEYDQYTTKIQAEYIHLPTTTYNQLRMKMLKNLVLMPNIYATREFQSEREKAARDNIQREADSLQA